MNIFVALTRYVFKEKEYEAYFLLLIPNVPYHSPLQFKAQGRFSRTAPTKGSFTSPSFRRELEDTLEENPANVYTKPVVVLEDVNHMHFASGEPPAAVVNMDILSPMSQVPRSHQLLLLLIRLKYFTCFCHCSFTKRLFGRE